MRKLALGFVALLASVSASAGTVTCSGPETCKALLAIFLTAKTTGDY